MKLIDTHCHLAHGRLCGEVPAILLAASDADVSAVICAGADLHESKTAANLAKKYQQVYFTAGISPHDAKTATPEALEQIEQLLRLDKNVALGEIGLDYHYDFSPPHRQQEAFAAQLAIAGRSNKPVVVHCRDAFDDTLAILAESQVDTTAVIFHSFTGDVASAAKILAMGASISFSGIVTFNNAQYLRQAAVVVPDDALLIETDSPYLSPEPVRNIKTNTPANVAYIADRLAAVRNTSAEHIAELTSDNAVRVFALKDPL